MRGVTVNGAEIHAARVKLGLTQRDLARLASVDAKTVRKAEQSGRLDLTPLTRLAYALRLDLQKLLVSDDAETGQQVIWRNVFMQWKRAFDECDGERLMAVYHDDAVLYLPGGDSIPFGGVARGKEAILRANQASWSNVRLEPIPLEDITFLASDNGLAFRAQRGVHTPSGEIYWCHVMQMLTFRENLILEHHVEFDTLEFLKRMQLPT